MLKLAAVLLAATLAVPASAQSIYGGNNPGYGSGNGGSYGGRTPNYGYGGSYGGSTPNYGYGTGSNPNSHSVPGYTTRDGGYVQPHQQTNPNNTQLDNYGTRGNLNPYNGTYGTRSPRY